MLFSFIEYIFGVIFRCVFVCTRLNATHSQHEKQSKRQIKRFSLWICVLSWSTIVFGLAIVYMLLDFSVLSKLFPLFLIFCCCYFSQFRYLSIRFECFMLFPTNSKAHRSQSDAFCVSPSNSKHDIRTKIMLTLSWHLCNAKKNFQTNSFLAKKKTFSYEEVKRDRFKWKMGYSTIDLVFVQCLAFEVSTVDYPRVQQYVRKLNTCERGATKLSTRHIEKSF